MKDSASLVLLSGHSEEARRSKAEPTNQLAKCELLHKSYCPSQNEGTAFGILPLNYIRPLRPWLLIALILTFLPIHAGAQSSPPSRPILFVHGFCGTAGSWTHLQSAVSGSLAANPALSALYTLTDNSGQQLVYEVYYDAIADAVTFIDPSTGALLEWKTVPPNARFFSIAMRDPSSASFDAASVANISILNKAYELSRVIKDITSVTHVQDVLVIDHSMGGLVTRAYLENLASKGQCQSGSTPNYGQQSCSPGKGALYAGDIGSVLTLDTPHGGTAATQWSTTYFSGCQIEPSTNKAELMPNSELLQAINFFGDPQGKLVPNVPSVPLQSVESYFSDEPSDKDNRTGSLYCWDSPPNNNLAWYCDDLITTNHQAIRQNLEPSHRSLLSNWTDLGNTFTEAADYDAVWNDANCWIARLQADPQYSIRMLHSIECLGDRPETQSLVSGWVAPLVGGQRTTITVSATLDGKQYINSVNYTISGGPITYQASEPLTFTDIKPSSYTLTGISGGPSSSYTISPSSTQSLGWSSDYQSRNWALNFSIDFTSNASPPTVTTSSATSVASTDVTLNGTINPNGSATQYVFIYGTSPTLAGAASTGTYGIGAGASPQNVSANAPGLSAGKTYYYQIQAWNSANSSSNPSKGSILFFSTPGAGKTAPTVGISPSPPSITTTQSVAVTVSVSGSGGIPTGSVTLSGGGYTSAAAALNNGSATFNIQAGALAIGSDTLTASYTPDSSSSSIYNTASGTGFITVSSPAKTTPTVAVSPLSTSITTAQPLSVNVLVYTSSGPSPTGTAALTIGGYTSPSVPLTNAATTIVVPAGSLAAGTYKPTVTYSGDTNYNNTSGTANSSVTVTGGATATLTVSVSGNGTVISTDGHISCPGTCSYAYTVGATVTLAINPASGYYDQVTGCTNGIINGNCSLTLASNASVNVTFTAQPTGIMLVQPSNMNFYQQVIGAPLNNSQTEYVLDNGGAALDQILATLSGPNASDFSYTNNCPTYGLNSGSCLVTVTFTPTAIGTRTASLSISSANATLTPQIVPLAGAGVVVPTESVTPSASSVTTNQNLTLAVSVTGNYGTPSGSLRISGGGYSATGVPLVGGSALISIPAGSLTAGTDTIWVYYDPDAASSNVYFGSSANVSVTVTGANSYSAPSEPVGTTSGQQTATIQFSSTFMLGSVVALTQGSQGLDFNILSGGTCTVGTLYNTGQTCTVNYSFTPTAPGTRSGAIEVFDNASPNPNLAAMVFLSGTGAGPLVVFLPGSQSQVGSGLYDPYCVAVDASQNLYISDTSNNRIIKETSSGGVYTQSVVDSGLAYPDGIAVDGAGNVYFADSGNSRIVKETLSGGVYTRSTVGSGLLNPDGVAVDASGNVYIADTGNNRILRETPSAGGYAESTVVAAGLSVPTGVAVDGSGDVFVADDFNNRVVMEVPSPSGYVQSTIASGLNHPYGVTVDGSGSVYIADSYNNRLLKESPSGGSYVQSTIGSGLSTPLGVAIDGSGNVYIADTNNSRVLKIDLSDPPSLAFATTASGSTSSDSPQIVTLANEGNALLTIPPPSTGMNPKVSPNFGLDSSTTCPQLSSSSSAATLAGGSSCTYAIDFSPVTTGSLNGLLILADNSVNEPHIMSLSGFGGSTSVGTSTKLTSSLDPSAFGQAVAITATVTQATGSIIPTGAVRFSFDGNPVGSPLALTNGMATYSANTWPAGSHTIAAVYVPGASSGFTASSAAPLVQAVSQANPSIAWNTPSAITYGTALSAAQLDASVSGIQGNIVYSPGAGATLTAGTHTLSATFTPVDSIDYTTATLIVQLIVNQATPVVSWAKPATIVYGTALGSIQLTATASVPGAFSYAPGAGTVLGVGNNSLTTTFTPTDAVNYSTTTSANSITVTPAALTVTATNQSRLYGAANPVFSGTVSGAVNGDAFTVSGSATATVASDVGKYAIVPSVAGTNLGDYTVTPLNGTLTIAQASSATSVSSSNANANLNSSVTLTSVVASSTSGTPTGVVDFYDGTTLLSAATLNGSGAASYTFSNLAAGTHSISAVYTGNTDFAGSSSSALPQVVSAPDFTISPSSASLTVKQGTVGTAVFTVTPVGGFNQSIQFSCLGVPEHSTCAFSPSTVTPNGSATSSTLTIQTDVGTAALTPPGDRSLVALAGLSWTAGLVGGFFLWMSRRRALGMYRSWLLLGTVWAGLLALTGVSGCGSGGGNQIIFLTPTGTDPITITATSAAGGSSHTATLALTITK